MSTPMITTLETLREYLQIAMQIEHATIPPYLTALYSIHPMTNSDATHILRVVVVEEMLHLTLAANILNAVGGKPDLTVPGFVPLYPAYLPDGEKDFQVHLQSFSKDTIENTFLKIERRDKAPDEGPRVLRRQSPAGRFRAVPGEPGLHFYSIGDFYEAIVRGLDYLYERLGKKMFTGDPKRQAISEYYYSGGGELFPVTCIDSAVRAAKLIIGQGEGFGGGIYDKENELAHYYRFEQLLKGKYYQAHDEPGKPTGPELKVNWDAVYPIKKNARLSDYKDFPELHAAAVAFNKSYADILAFLTSAFNGNPQLLLEAVPKMFGLRDRMTQLIHVPISGMDGVNAAPTFEVDGVAAGGAR